MWYKVCSTLLTVRRGPHIKGARCPCPLPAVIFGQRITEKQEGRVILAWEGTLAGGASPMARHPQASGSQPHLLQLGRAEGQGRRGAGKPRVSLAGFVGTCPCCPDGSVPGPDILLTL